MLHRRVLLAAPLAGLPFIARAQTGFAAFLDALRGEAEAAGIRRSVIEAAFAGVHLDPQVLQRDRTQPEFTLTWAQYKTRVLPSSRLKAAASAYATHGRTLIPTAARYRCDTGVVVGIWGLESGFGAHTGNFHIVGALATLAYQGRRAGYFKTELLNALRILNAGDIAPAAMTGSWAGAMGQPQFMPSSYLQYAVDFDGDGKRDIWNSLPDVFGSVANYLSRCGWRNGEPWGQPVRVPQGYAGPEGRDGFRPLGAWQQQGIRRLDGSRFSTQDVSGALVMPDGAGGQAFMVYHNFHVIRRYNPSDYYALAVGLLGNAAS